MKLLYCIFAIFLVTKADPVRLTREELESLAGSILKIITIASKTIDGFTDMTKSAASKKILEYKLVQKFFATVGNKTKQVYEERHELPEDLRKCNTNIFKAFEKLVDDLTDGYICKLTTEKYGKQGDYLGTLQKELSVIKGALENHANEEIESCLNRENGCKLTNEYRTKIAELFAIVDLATESKLASW